MPEGQPSPGVQGHAEHGEQLSPQEELTKELRVRLDPRKDEGERHSDYISPDGTSISLSTGFPQWDAGTLRVMVSPPESRFVGHASGPADRPTATRYESVFWMSEAKGVTHDGVPLPDDEARRLTKTLQTSKAVPEPRASVDVIVGGQRVRVSAQQHPDDGA